MSPPPRSVRFCSCGFALYFVTNLGAFFPLQIARGRKGNVDRNFERGQGKDERSCSQQGSIREQDVPEGRLGNHNCQQPRCTCWGECLQLNCVGCFVYLYLLAFFKCLLFPTSSTCWPLRLDYSRDSPELSSPAGSHAPSPGSASICVVLPIT